VLSGVILYQQFHPVFATDRTKLKIPTSSVMSSSRVWTTITEENPSKSASWLSAKGIYQEHVRQNGKTSPGLRAPDPGNVKAPLGQRHAAIKWLAVQDDSSIHNIFEMPAGQDFARFNAELLKAPRGSRNVLLIEGLNPALVEVLGSRFGMDPSFFVDYERTSVWRCHHNEPNLVRPLPSSRQPEHLWCITYCELREFGPKFEGHSVGCMDTGRYIARNKEGLEFISTCVVDRKCSYWYTQPLDGGWWGEQSAIPQSFF
jgi:hypothetical protein